MSLLRQPASCIGRDVRKLTETVRETQLKLPTHRNFWTCRECRNGNALGGRAAGREVRGQWLSRRQFSSTVRRRDERPTDTRKPLEPIQPASPARSEPDTPASSSSSLPSHTANRRSERSKQASRILDTLLARASVASQHINAYTGTDYSGIEALRKEIIEQEQKARTLHSTVDEAKAKHHEAYAKQTSAQREIVGLLERKSSWSPSDLERYMSLVRSEHLNDQDVQGAKDNLAVAEHDLEGARSLLEKLERKQYHEEQIWSDTIRRNSTWVTFGLMGVNILLLLAQIAIFEPHRRKKIVRDVKIALDEKTLTAAPSIVETEKRIDATIPPGDAILEQGEQKFKLSTDELLPADAVEVVDSKPTTQGELVQLTGETISPIPGGNAISNGTWKAYQEAFHDLFSDRLVQIRKVDVTNTALQGAATGVAIMGILFVLLQPK